MRKENRDAGTRKAGTDTIFKLPKVAKSRDRHDFQTAEGREKRGQTRFFQTAEGREKRGQTRFFQTAEKSESVPVFRGCGSGAMRDEEQDR